MIILEMALNIEHFTKVDLIRKITDSDVEDGYKIVQDYTSSLSTKKPSIFKQGTW